MNLLTYHIFLPIILFIYLQYTNSFIFPFIRSHNDVKSSSPSWLSTPTTSYRSEVTLLRRAQSYLLSTTTFTTSTVTTTTEATIEASVIAPPKTDTKKKNDVKIDPIVKDNKSSNVQKLYEEFIQENNEEYMVILYDDPFNKRAYVASVLMDVFSWSEDMANSGAYCSAVLHRLTSCCCYFYLCLCLYVCVSTSLFPSVCLSYVCTVASLYLYQLILCYSMNIDILHYN